MNNGIRELKDDGKKNRINKKKVYETKAIMCFFFRKKNEF